MSSIKPTIGRKVWYFGSFGNVVDSRQPFDATVIYVWGDTCVNLQVIDHTGKVYTETSVMLRDPQDGDQHGVGLSVATWMPFQVGQARQLADVGATANSPGPGALRQADTSDAAIERDIRAAGKTVARVTPADLEAEIASEWYFTAANGVAAADGLTRVAAAELSLLTFCVLVLRNGFTVTGESACASPENFDAELGRKIARQNAVNKAWPLMGYHLKQKLAES